MGLGRGDVEVLGLTCWRMSRRRGWTWEVGGIERTLYPTDWGRGEGEGAVKGTLK